MLEATDIRKEFGGLVAVDDVSIDIGSDEIVGLIGPNGAGKTTLFNTITGILDPEEGAEIRFDGRDLLALEPHDIAHVGVVRTFQIVRVFDEMSAKDNVVAGALFGSGESLSMSAAEDRADEELEFMGLSGHADTLAANLPIAQKKQLELAQALASDPKLVLLDEIASGLTPGEISTLSDTIRRIRDERGVSVFWIEHIMDAIMGTADRIVVLNSGRKIAEGTPDEIRQNEQVIQAYLGGDA